MQITQIALVAVGMAGVVHPCYPHCPGWRAPDPWRRHDEDSILPTTSGTAAQHTAVRRAAGVPCRGGWDGLVCPFCVYGIEKKLGQLDGVANIDTDLKTGQLRIQMQPDKTLTEGRCALPSDRPVLACVRSVRQRTNSRRVLDDPVQQRHAQSGYHE